MRACVFSARWVCSVFQRREMENMWRNLHNKKTRNIKERGGEAWEHPQTNQSPKKRLIDASQRWSSSCHRRSFLTPRHQNDFNIQYGHTGAKSAACCYLTRGSTSSVRGETPQLSPQHSRDWKQLNIRKYSYQWMWKTLTTGWLLHIVKHGANTSKCTI